MDPGLALFLVCRVAHRFYLGADSDLLSLDVPLLMELVGMGYLDYQPRFITRCDFHSLVCHHYTQVGVEARFLTETRLKWMLMIFERLYIGEIRLPIASTPRS
jgi:hypothetical protein